MPLFCSNLVLEFDQNLKLSGMIQVQHAEYYVQAFTNLLNVSKSDTLARRE